MITYNIEFIKTNGKRDEMQLDIEEQNTTEEEVVELMNLILNLKDEKDIEKITKIEYMECID